MQLANFAEQFAAKTYRRTWQAAVTPAITNKNYEGEIKKAGDRVNILQFLNDIVLGDYVVGTDMSTETIIDDEDQLIVEKRKYYNFSLDRLEEMFTYASDVPDTLTENAGKTLERLIDAYTLENAQYAKAGNWVGIDLRVLGSSRDTEASIATSATGGTLTVQSPTVGAVATVEMGDGTLAFSGFTAADVGKGVRLTSGTSWATEWYRITAVSNSTTATIENWDGATAGSDIPNGDVLRGLGGGSEFSSAQNFDGKPTTEGGWGYELQAAFSTSVTASTAYAQIVDLAERLSRNEIPTSDRHLTGPTQYIAVLKKASEFQPDVQIAYEGVVLNGKVGKAGGFEVHEAAGIRVSTRVGHATSTGQGGDVAVTTGTLAHQILANHISFITYADKWSESRVVDAENQFAKKYQGLYLFGAKVTKTGRKAGAVLFGAL